MVVPSHGCALASPTLRHVFTQPSAAGAARNPRLGSTPDLPWPDPDQPRPRSARCPTVPHSPQGSRRGDNSRSPHRDDRTIHALLFFFFFFFLERGGRREEKRRGEGREKEREGGERRGRRGKPKSQISTRFWKVFHERGVVVLGNSFVIVTRFGFSAF